MKKVIYTEFSSHYWLGVALRLAKENDWQPAYWTALPIFESAVKKQFPKAVFHASIDAIRGIRAAKYSHNLLPALDACILAELASVQLMTLKMMDRIDVFGSLSYHDRVRLFTFQLKYWQAILDDIKPEVVIFSVIPHMVYDYVLYELCKRRGIQTIMFETTPFQGLTFAMSRFDGVSRVEKLYQQLLSENSFTKIALSSETQAYLQALQGSYQDAPEYIRRTYKEELYKGLRGPSKKLLQKLFDVQQYSKYIKKQIQIMRAKFAAPENYLKQPHKKLENSQMNFMAYKIFRFRAYWMIRQLIRHYESLTSDVSFNQPYIYVALNYQPERTTAPMGSFFVNQYHMVDLLAQILPEGWSLYVKEHPTQYTPSMFFRAQSGRTKDFYDDIAGLPNVTLVPMEINSFQLIDHAQAVATVTGTVGWEALNRGKPVLLFGHTWYRGCEGAFRIDSHSSCEEAISKIKNGYCVDFEKIRVFAYALQQLGINASVEAHLQITSISMDDRIARLTKAIQEFT